MPTLEEISRQKLLAAAASYNPANNPPAASTVARGRAGGAVAPVAPLASPVQMTRVGRGGIQTPVVGQDVPGPRFQQGPVGSGGAGRGRVLPLAGSGATGDWGIQDANAAVVRASTSPAAVTPPVPLSQVPPAARTALAPVLNVQRNYGTQQGITKVTNPDMPGEAPLFTNNPSATAAASGAPPDNSGDYWKGKSAYPPGSPQALAWEKSQGTHVPSGTMSVIGMGLSPEDTLAKLKEQTAAWQELNRYKETGLSEGELSKVDKRRAHDSEIFQLTQGGVPLQAATGFVAQRDAALAKQTAETPTQVAAGRQALALGEQKLQTGEMDMEKRQQLQAAFQAALKVDPKDTQAHARAMTEYQMILSAQPGYKQPAARYSYAKPSIDPITSQQIPGTGGVLDTQGGTITPLSQPNAARPGGAPPAEGSQMQGPDGVIYTVKGGVPVGPDGKPYAGA